MYQIQQEEWRGTLTFGILNGFLPSYNLIANKQVIVAYGMHQVRIEKKNIVKIAIGRLLPFIDTGILVSYKGVIGSSKFRFIPSEVPSTEIIERLKKLGYTIAN